MASPRLSGEKIRKSVFVFQSAGPGCGGPFSINITRRWRFGVIDGYLLRDKMVTETLFFRPTLVK
jgi:hypothetical protein